MLTTAEHETAQRRVNTLLNHKQRLVDAFVHRSAIDRRTYQEQLDELNEEIALAEIDERDARIEEIDIQAAVSFGEFVLLNAPRLWAELSLEQRQRLQQLLFRMECIFKLASIEPRQPALFSSIWKQNRLKKKVW